MRLKFELEPPVSIMEVEKERKEYLTNLKEAQVLLIENMLQEMSFQKIRWINGGKEDKIIGYVAIKEKKIYEMYMEGWYATFMNEVIAKLITNGLVEKAVCKTFDSNFLLACLTQQKSYQIIGYLSRTYIKQPLPDIGIEFDSKIASIEDLDKVLSVKQEAFTVQEKIESLIRKGQIFLFELPENASNNEKDNNRTIGFGFIQPIVPFQGEVEVGWAVDPHYRNKGYAAYLMQYLCETAKEKGHKPVGSALFNNLKSINTAGRVGLVKDHCLLEINFVE